MFDSALVDSNSFKFFHYYSCAFCNMATFHVTGRLDLTIMVDESRTTIVPQHCRCVMFVFQPGSLHISKDISYDNFISSFLYSILMTSSQGRQWLVGCGHYHIVGDSLAHNFQDTILTIRIARSTVKTMKQEFKVDDILLQCFDNLASFNFIELFNSLAGEDLTPPPSLMK